jgi:hypothetical protein
MIKRFSLLIFALMLGSAFCFSQEAPASNADGKNNATTTVDETKILLQNQTQGNLTASEKSVSFFGSLWKLIIMLIIVCGLAYIVLRFLKKSQTLSMNDDPYLHMVSSLKLAPNKSLYIITLKREAFLIAVTEKDVSLISKIEDTELIDAFNLYAENSPPMQKSFAEMLSTFFRKDEKSPAQQKQTVQKKAESSDELTDNFLQGMRERLSQSDTNTNENHEG